MNALSPLLGILAGLAGIANAVPYVRDTVRGSTRPHRGTWLIWGVLAIIACLSQRADGASWSVLLTATQAALTGLVFVLAIRYGEGGASRADLALIALAGGGLVGWMLAGDPVVATGCVIAADLIAVGMMLPKVRRDPDSETLSTYALASLGGALAAGAAAGSNLSILVYPAYYCLVNAVTAILIQRQRAILGVARETDGRKPPRRRVARAWRGLRTELQTPPYAPRHDARPGPQAVRGLADA